MIGKGSERIEGGRDRDINGVREGAIVGGTRERGKSSRKGTSAYIHTEDILLSRGRGGRGYYNITAVAPEWIRLESIDVAVCLGLARQHRQLLSVTTLQSFDKTVSCERQLNFI